MSPLPPQLTIRPETPADHPAVRQVHTLAFGQDGEAVLVDALRRTEAYIPDLSLVAVAKDIVLGHVLFTRVYVENAHGVMHAALALAPLAVLPYEQRKGIGSALVRQGLAACRRLGEPCVIVLGHPGYYPRFGFVPALRHGITAPFPLENDDAFMLLELRPKALDGISGIVRYSTAFDGL